MKRLLYLTCFIAILGDTDDDDDGPEKKKRKKSTVNPFTTFSVTEIIEKRHQGVVTGMYLLILLRQLLNVICIKWCGCRAK